MLWFQRVDSSRLVDYAKTILLVIVIAFMLVSQAETLYSNLFVLSSIVAPVALFFLLIPLLDLLIVKILDLSYGEYVLLTFTTTARNSEASLAVAATAFPGTLIH